MPRHGDLNHRAELNSPSFCSDSAGVFDFALDGDFVQYLDPFTIRLGTVRDFYRPDFPPRTDLFNPLKPVPVQTSALQSVGSVLGTWFGGRKVYTGAEIETIRERNRNAGRENAADAGSTSQSADQIDHHRSSVRPRERRQYSLLPFGSNLPRDRRPLIRPAGEYRRKPSSFRARVKAHAISWRGRMQPSSSAASIFKPSRTASGRPSTMPPSSPGKQRRLRRMRPPSAPSRPASAPCGTGSRSKSISALFIPTSSVRARWRIPPCATQAVSKLHLSLHFWKDKMQHFVDDGVQ